MHISVEVSETGEADERIKIGKQHQSGDFEVQNTRLIYSGQILAQACPCINCPKKYVLAAHQFGIVFQYNRIRYYLLNCKLQFHYEGGNL